MQKELTKNMAEKQWLINSELYKSYFNTIRDKLPPKFIKIYDEENGFHDCIIKEITIKSIERKTKRDTINFLIVLSNGTVNYFIEFKNAEIIKMNVSSNIYCICGRISWGYSEFEILDNKKIKLSILCDVINEIELIFDNIVINKKQV